MSFKDYKKAIDIIVKNNYGNTLRVFSSGIWEPKTKGQVRFPFKKVKGKFDLEQINKKWLNETLRRIKYFVDRDGTVIYALIDGCSLNYFPRAYPKAFWGGHWWNGGNNVNGTSGDPRSIRYMFLKNSPEHEATRYYVLKFLDEMIGILESHFPKCIIYDFNELDCDAQWYSLINRLVFQKHKIPKRRKMFSFSGSHSLDEIPIIAQKHTWQVHGIDSLEKYRAINRLGLQSVHISCDGQEPTDKAMTKRLVYNILKSRDLGYENNRNWSPEAGFWEQIDFAFNQGMKQGLLKWLRSR